ncbi:hypothetical protein BZA70DRAFT_27772 [Myxozyma melibiosi]|uniref:Amidohydrolase-related domain-containing protein n=1 Tax=Myxozyma melibiosi TaxID=54550 RepID=A0ABR1FDC3_9ASCO
MTDDAMLPTGAWDTHVHIFAPSTHPYASTRSYSPLEAPLPALLAHSRSISATDSPTNLVLVQPSPYGRENSLLVEALASLNSDPALSSVRARGIAVVDSGSATAESLQVLHDSGVRGLRINLESSVNARYSTDELKTVIADSAAAISFLPGWVLQLFIKSTLWDDLLPFVMTLRVPIIADHLGGLLGASKSPVVDSANPLSQPGYASLVRLAREGRVYIKVSGLYRASNARPGFEDLEPIISALARDAPDQLLYASDWPHTGEAKDRLKRSSDAPEAFQVIDDRLVIANLRKWVAPVVWQKMCVDNPARLFSN